MASIHVLQIYRGISLIAEFEINESTVFSKTLMADHDINCAVTLPASLGLQINDYITYKERTYKINILPELTKTDTDYVYGITLEPDSYTLYNKIFLHLGDSDFTYFGTLLAFSNLIIDNINTIDPGWSLGTVDILTEQEITFSADSCRTALTKIADAFKVEYEVDGKIITIKKTIGKNRDLTFKVGIYNGLYSLQRTQVSDKNVITTVFGFGSDKNIDYTYRNNTKRLVFEQRKLSKNVDLYGTREGIYINDDIYPHRTGTVSSINGQLKVIDNSIDFDFNTYLLDGIPAKITFNTGALSGVTFEIESYNNTTKTITFKIFKDTNNYVLPSSTRQASIGDKYLMTDIRMPQSYITDAELELYNATNTYLNENSQPQVQYDLDIDEKYVRDLNIQLNAGDFIRIVDDVLGIDGYLRIAQISYPLVNDANIKCTISNYVIDNTQNRQIAAILNNRSDIQSHYTGNIIEARRQTANLATLKDTIFDPTGNYFDPINFKPNSIETLFLSTGSKANDFNLSEVVIKANLLGNQNDIQITDGMLLHNTIDIPGLGFIWVMNGISQTGLTTSIQYWIYAKCSTSALTGTFVISASRILVNDVPGFYHFTIGTLYPANLGFRNFDFVKGMAYLVGDTLTAGVIKSIDAQTYWDLTQGKLKLGTGTNGVDWNVTTPNTFTIRGAIVQNPGGATSPINVFRGSYTTGQTYYKGDSVQYNGSTWSYINLTPTNNQIPAENTYWTALAHKGADGTSVNIKGSVSSYSNLPTTGNTIGDGYITADTGHLWMWNGTGWNDLGQLKGDKGDPGIPGITRRTYFAKNNSYTIAPALSQVVNPAGWTAVAPVTDDNVYLADNLGNTIQDNLSNDISIGLNPEFLWVIYENLDANGVWISWSLPNRLTGRPANPGDFTEVRFAVNGSPTVAPSLDINNSFPPGWTTSVPAFGTLQYLWKIYGAKDGSTNLLYTQWSVPIRETAIDGKDGVNGTNGADGAQGQQGVPGALPQGGQVYNASKQYTGNTFRVDIVRYNDGSGEKAYAARTDAGTFSGILPTNTAKWNAFGGQFTSVATDLFFAQLAFIENLGVRYLRTSESGRRLEINADTNSQSFYGLNGTTAYEALKIADNIDAGSAGNPLAGVISRNPNGKLSFLSGNGLLSNASGVQILSSSTGIDSNASIVGLLSERLSDPNAISAGVASVDISTTGSSQSFANYSAGMTGSYGGKCNQIRTIQSGTQNLNRNDYMIYTVPTANITLNLPTEGVYQGRTLFFKNTPSTSNTYSVNIIGAGVSFNNSANSTVIYVYSEGSWIKML